MLQSLLALGLLISLSLPLLESELFAVALTQNSFDRSLSLLDQHCLVQYQQVIERC